MNLILESILNEQLIREVQIDNNSLALDFLDEYLASTRGISLSEAQELIVVVEIHKRKGMVAIDKTAMKTAVKLKETYNTKKSEIITEDLSKIKKSKELKRLKKITLPKMKAIKKWAEEQRKALSKMSTKKKVAIAGAAVGVPIIAGGLKAYAIHRRNKREASK